MTTKAVEELVTRFRKIKEEISTVTKEREKVRTNHVTFWKNLQTTCELEGHDSKVVQAEKEELRKLERKIRNTPLRKITPEECRRKIQLGAKFEMWEIFGSPHFCPYCKKLLNKSFQVRHLNNKLYDREYLNYLINHSESDWPEEKLEMLRQIKQEAEEFLQAAESLEERLKTLQKEQKEIWEQIHKIWELCDSVLGISESHEQRIRDIEYANRPSPPFGDPDSFWE